MAEDPIDEVGDRVEDVLAIVEQQQHLGIVEHRGQSVGQRLTDAAIDRQRCGDDVDCGLLVCASEFAHHDGTLRASRLQTMAGLDEEPGLPDSARPNECEQTPVASQVDDLLHRRRSALERRDSERESARRSPRHGIDTGEEVRLLGGQHWRRRDPQLLGEQATEVVVHP